MSPRANANGWLAETWRFGKAQLSSGAATGVDWALVATTLFLLGDARYPWAVAVGAVGGAIADFLLKRGWVFEARGAGVRRQIIRYALVSAASLGWNELLSWVAVSRLHLPALPGVIAAAVVVAAAWNYPTQRLFVFRREGGEPSPEMAWPR